MATARPAITSQRQVTFLACRADAREHELATQRGVAARLAALMGCRFDEVREIATSAAVDLGYVVPDVTIASLDTALALGIRSEEDLFGGVVPFPFVAAKTITHPLIDPAAAAPQGWQADFPERVRDVTLPGWSAFSLSDARAAGRRLLQGGEVRVKLASGIGGAGQSVARSEAELDAQLAAIDPAEFAEGVVLERNLVDVRTYSVGRVRVGSMLASYIGTQRTTRSCHGKEVYGGSSIEVVRGGFEALDRLALEDGARRAIRGARAYHEAAMACFAGMFASRCNYDVVEGRDASGRQWVGVLEQSWRIGGASGAEVAALEALTTIPRCRRCAHRPPRCMGRAFRCPRGRSCISPVSTIISGRSPNMRRSIAMAVREQKVAIRGGSGTIDGTLVLPGVLDARRAVRPWLGRKPAAVPGARARGRRTGLRLPDVRPGRACRHPTAAREGVTREQSLRPARRLRRAGRASLRRRLGDRRGGQQLWRLSGDDPDVDAAGVVARAARSGALHRHRLGAAEAAVAPGSRPARISPQLRRGRDEPRLACLLGVQGRRAAARIGARRLHSARRHQELSRRVYACPLAHLPLHAGCRSRRVGRDEPARLHRAARAVARRDASRCTP